MLVGCAALFSLHFHGAYKLIATTNSWWGVSYTNVNNLCVRGQLPTKRMIRQLLVFTEGWESIGLLYPRPTKLEGGYTGFTLFYHDGESSIWKGWVLWGLTMRHVEQWLYVTGWSSHQANPISIKLCFPCSPQLTPSASRSKTRSIPAQSSSHVYHQTPLTSPRTRQRLSPKRRRWVHICDVTRVNQNEIFSLYTFFLEQTIWGWSSTPPPTNVVQVFGVHPWDILYLGLLNTCLPSIATWMSHIFQPYFQENFKWWDPTDVKTVYHICHWNVNTSCILEHLCSQLQDFTIYFVIY